VRALRRLAAGSFLVLAACTATPVSSTPGPSAAFSFVPGVGGPAEEIGCQEPMDLRGLDGDRPDLTGLWSTAGDPVPSWNVRQINSCFFIASINYELEPEYYQELCDGEIGSDFVITARCVDFLHVVSQPVMGREYFLISFTDDGEVVLERCLERDVPATCEDPFLPWEPPT
jgi:hypothetical protein